MQRRRRAAAESFAPSPRPSEKEEIWRYSRIDQLELDRFVPSDGSTDRTDEGSVPVVASRARELADDLGPMSGILVTVDGTLAVSWKSDEHDVLLGRIREHPGAEELLGSVMTDPQDFDLLNDAFSPDPLFIDSGAGVEVGPPVVVVHVVTGAAGRVVFPRTVVRAQEGSYSA